MCFERGVDAGKVRVGFGGGDASVMPCTIPPRFPPGGVLNLPSGLPLLVAGGMTFESEGGLGCAGLTQAGFGTT